MPLRSVPGVMPAPGIFLVKPIFFIYVLRCEHLSVDSIFKCLESADGNTRSGCATLAPIRESRRSKASLYADVPESSDIDDGAAGT